MLQAEVRKRRSPQDAGITEAAYLTPQVDSGDKRERPQQQPQGGGKDIDDSKETSKSILGQYFEWDRPLEKTSFWLVLLFTFLALGTRFYHIAKGDFVVWDEAHFGKFGSYYLNQTFYFDVHPPLGKMLVAVGGLVAGYNGSFAFNSGADYPPGLHYSIMRMFVASFGSMIVPLVYIAAIQLRLRQPTAVLVALMTLFENGLIGITRLILLDSMLLCFTTLAFTSYAWFRNQSSRPFGRTWRLSLVLTGVGIGCVSSVKWVGFFITALIGFLTIEELWNMLGDPRMPKKVFLKHFGSRAFGLIIVPLAIYMISFQAHFSVLNRSGSGDANMSSLFQAGLAGNDLSSSPMELAYGSYVTLKSNTYGGGLLHSHVQTYPGGSKQQQVTTYHHKDHNNLWRIIYPAKEGDIDYETLDVRKVRNGDIIRLLHNSTGRLLHSHRIAAPVNIKDYEVSGYGRIDYDDPNDLWQVEIVKDVRPGEPILRALTTRFRLKHTYTGCYLKSRNNALPQWGFRQGEVSCDYTPELGAKYLEWNVETHINDKLPPGTPDMYRSNFLDDFIDCNVGMYKTNNALIPDAELEPGQLVSRASEWFLMRRGIRMCSWADDRVKFYMLGNPAVWWTGSAAIITTIILCVTYILFRQRKALHLLPTHYEAFKYRVKMITGGWALTYLPFFVMGRVLYVHHYYPALIFSTLNVGLLFDHFLARRPSRVQWTVAIIASAIVFGVFIYFSPMCYGIEGPGKAFRGRRWLKSWNL